MTNQLDQTSLPNISTVRLDHLVWLLSVQLYWVITLDLHLLEGIFLCTRSQGDRLQVTDLRVKGSAFPCRWNLILGPAVLNEVLPVVLDDVMEFNTLLTAQYCVSIITLSILPRVSITEGWFQNTPYQTIITSICTLSTPSFPLPLALHPLPKPQGPVVSMDTYEMMTRLSPAPPLLSPSFPSLSGFYEYL